MRKIGLTLVLLVLALPLSAAKIPVTIIIEPSIKYENVYINVNQLFKAISIEFADSLKLISFDRIKTIYDLTGKDITDAVLSGKYKPNKATKTLAKESHFHEYKRVRKHWSIGLRVGSAYSPNVGHYYRGTKSDPGFHGDLMIALDSNLSLLIGAVFPRIRFKDDYYTISSSPILQVTGQNQKINSSRFSLGLQYYSHSFVKMRPYQSIPYVCIGVGWIMDEIEFRATYRDLDYNKSYSGAAGYDERIGYLYIGAGTILPLLSRFGIDFETDLNWILSRNRIDDKFNWVVPISEPNRAKSSFSLDLRLSLVYIN
jgi:hypothetical protein